MLYYFEKEKKRMQQETTTFLPEIRKVIVLNAHGQQWVYIGALHELALETISMPRARCHM